MKWTSTLRSPAAGGASLERVLTDCCRQVRDNLGGAAPDLVVGFVSPHFIEEFEQYPQVLMRELGPRVAIGCSAGGLIGGGQEVEDKAAVAITGALLPGVDVQAFHVEDGELPDSDDPPSRWEEVVGVEAGAEPHFILLPDPFSIHVDALVEGLDFAFPKSVKVGGLASGGHTPGINALFLNDRLYRSGAVGLTLSGNLIVETVVAQGCKPIGRAMRVTRCDRNFLLELDGEPAVNALHETLLALAPHDRDLARNSLFLGVVMDEFKEDPQHGDFLIRNILGLEPKSGGLLVGEVLRPERTVQFHLRDAAISGEDLRLMLKKYSDSHPQAPDGALLFSCLGRGQYLYGRPNHDSECFRQYLGEIPLGGFFCSGEIGPVGGTTFLHGYTSSFGIFRARESAAV